VYLLVFCCGGFSSILAGNLDIITEDGRNLFSIRLNKDGSIEVSAGDTCKVDGVLLDDQLRIKPIACNMVELRKPPYV